MRSLDALCCTQTHTGNHIHTRTLLNRPQTLLQPRFFCCISYPSMVTLSCECCHTLSISCLMCWLPFHDMLLLTTPQNNPCISSHVQSFIVCNMRYLCIKVLSVPSKNRIIAIIIHLERSDCVQQQCILYRRLQISNHLCLSYCQTVGNKELLFRIEGNIVRVKVGTKCFLSSLCVGGFTHYL